MLALFLEILVLIHAIYQKNNIDSLILAYLIIFFFAVLFLMPTNAFGGAGLSLISRSLLL